ncbi:MAG: zinc ribbon domain-containing protein [Candidatus Lokiarchaeota archaeon]|nr:zinc ribbon domain-containing protein [Candidatus Lokiarchaeota archaeon]
MFCRFCGRKLFNEEKQCPNCKKATQLPKSKQVKFYRCKNCENEVPNDSIFCGYCSHKSFKKQKERGTKPILKWKIINCFLFGMVGISLTLYGFLNSITLMGGIGILIIILPPIFLFGGSDDDGSGRHDVDGLADSYRDFYDFD